MNKQQGRRATHSLQLCLMIMKKIKEKMKRERSREPDVSDWECLYQDRELLDAKLEEVMDEVRIARLVEVASTMNKLLDVGHEQGHGPGRKAILRDGAHNMNEHTGLLNMEMVMDMWLRGRGYRCKLQRRSRSKKKLGHVWDRGRLNRD